ncbi:hypothetical protein FHX81_7138 [Saccharothrix saharensis]|uniref:Uncharacterized protein n=1 Tax=Saccharothrix saharensis TaxID=571190 RepID=A0A543JPE0_9PSEU|nr:hypothetical protein FHX81_7138 [Saccharothrix saharensis]
MWALPVVLGLVLPLWEEGPPVEASAALVIAGVLLRARQAHAERPGAWFPLLVTGSTAVAVVWSGELVEFRLGPAFDLWRYLVGLAVAIGLGCWAWRARYRTVAVTAAAYLAAIQYLGRGAEPVAEFGWTSYGPADAAVPAFDPVLGVDLSAGQPHPELVIVAGAVFAHARPGRVRPWHVAALAGLLGSLWHQGAMALLLVAAVLAAHDLNARRPGAWYPLLMVGVGLAVWPVLDALTAPAWPEPVIEDPGAERHAVLVAGAWSTSAAVAPTVDHDELFLAVVVAAGLAVWSWRRRSPIVLLTALAHLGGAWVGDLPVGTGPVVLAGAAVALATTAAPRAAQNGWAFGWNT